MGLAVVYSNLDTDNRELDQLTFCKGSLETFVYSRDVLGRNLSTLYFVYEFIVLAILVERLDESTYLTVLTGTAGLLLMCVLKVGPLGDSLAVCNLRCTSGDLGLVLSLHSLDVYIKMKLSHTGDDCLVGFLIHIAAECRVFFCEPVDSLCHVVGSLLVHRLDGEGDNCVRNIHGCHGVVEGWVTECVARSTVHAEQCHDVSTAAF